MIVSMDVGQLNEACRALGRVVEENSGKVGVESVDVVIDSWMASLGHQETRTSMKIPIEADSYSKASTTYLSVRSYLVYLHIGSSVPMVGSARKVDRNNRSVSERLSERGCGYDGEERDRPRQVERSSPRSGGNCRTLQEFWSSCGRFQLEISGTKYFANLYRALEKL